MFVASCVITLGSVWGKPGGPCVAVFCVIGIGTGGSGGAKTSLIFIHAVQIAVYYITCMLHAHGTCILPYSGKFSLVQIFTEKGPDSSEEIFAVFIFADAGHSGHTPTSWWPRPICETALNDETKKQACVTTA